MKTTLELPDDLLIEAKAVAARRRTTLKAMIEHALRCELGSGPSPKPAADDLFEGILSLKRRGAKITSERIYRLLEEEEDLNLS